MKVNDQELLDHIRSPFTKELGFRQLIETYQKPVYQVIRRMVLIHEDADDLTQNTFIKAYKALDRFEGNSTLFTWLYRIATNESLTFLEKRKNATSFPWTITKKNWSLMSILALHLVETRFKPNFRNAY